MTGKYNRDPHYGRSPSWGRLYDRFFPTCTDPWSRHVKIIAKDILRDRNSPVRRMLMDAGYEPDYWAQSMEVTVRELWQAREKLKGGSQ